MLIIKKKRIRNLEKYFQGITKNSKVIIGLSNLEEWKSVLHNIGFSVKYDVGEATLPPPSFGPISSFNALGKNEKLYDKPMETCYRVVLWEWQDWGGNTHSKFVDVPYERYQRKFIEPPSIELILVENESKDKILCSPTFTYIEEETEIILHTINLFLEIFGECEVFSKDLKTIKIPKVIRLNWELLPQGEYPWERVKKIIDPIVESEPEGNQPFIQARLEILNSANPDFIAYGKNGFTGYLVFGFPNKDNFILESIRYGNATYIFDKNWETLSQLTKADIINGRLQKDRIIHLTTWKKLIKKYLP